MAPSILQNAGLLLGVIGAASLITATALNKWSLRDRQDDLLEDVYVHSGLWEDCWTTSSGLTQCHHNYGILGDAGTLQAVQGLMTVGMVLSVLAEFASIFSLTSLTVSTVEDSTKAKMSLGAGIMFIIAGVLSIAGASIYASQIVAGSRVFTSSSYNKIHRGHMLDGMGIDGGTSTYSFGPALFVAWIGGTVLIAGGALSSLAFREMVTDGNAREFESNTLYRHLMAVNLWFKLVSQSRSCRKHTDITPHIPVLVYCEVFTNVCFSTNICIWRDTRIHS
ncbi:claudin-18 [Nelusetta ayraudi]|uniref:claudin-18 n=1 Tax=Nelusetta ayraudi TaxID=303726 RepID=UPI003F6E5605